MNKEELIQEIKEKFASLDELVERRSPNWKKIRSSSTTEVYEIYLPGISVPCYQAVGIVPCPPRYFFEQVVLNDNSLRRYSSVKEIRSVEKGCIEDLPFEIYRQLHSPIFSISARDFSVCRSWKLGDDTDKLVGFSVEHEQIPEEPGSFVRGVVHLSGWKAIAIEGSNQCRIHCIVQTDIKGNLPKWIVSKGVLGEVSGVIDNILKMFHDGTISPFESLSGGTNGQSNVREKIKEENVPSISWTKHFYHSKKTLLDLHYQQETGRLDECWILLSASSNSRVWMKQGTKKKEFLSHTIIPRTPPSLLFRYLTSEKLDQRKKWDPMLTEFRVLEKKDLHTLIFQSQYWNQSWWDWPREFCILQQASQNSNYSCILQRSTEHPTCNKNRGTIRGEIDNSGFLIRPYIQEDKEVGSELTYYCQIDLKGFLQWVPYALTRETYSKFYQSATSIASLAFAESALVSSDMTLVPKKPSLPSLKPSILQASLAQSSVEKILQHQNDPEWNEVDEESGIKLWIKGTVYKAISTVNVPVIAVIDYLRQVNKRTSWDYFCTECSLLEHLGENIRTVEVYLKGQKTEEKLVCVNCEAEPEEDLFVFIEKSFTQPQQTDESFFGFILKANEENPMVCDVVYICDLEYHYLPSEEKTKNIFATFKALRTEIENIQDLSQYVQRTSLLVSPKLKVFIGNVFNAYSETQGKFQVYEIKIEGEDFQKNIGRRYSEFRSLYYMIAEEFPSIRLPNFPSRTILAVTEKDIFKRKQVFNEFLKVISENETLLQHEYVKEFLTLNTSD